MNLSKLRTPPPLSDSDYAAIRARVMAEVAHRSRPRPFWRMALALATTLIVVLLLIPSRENESLPQAPRIAESGGAIQPPDASLIAPALPSPAAVQGAAAPSAPMAPSTSPPARVARRAPRKPPLSESMAAAPLHIEIHTTDPDIRIIWIVNPELPTEES